MHPHPDSTALARMAANLRHAIGLTELGLALRLAVLRQQKPESTMKDVMNLNYMQRILVFGSTKR